MGLERIGRMELVDTDVDQEWAFPEGSEVYGILTGQLEAEGLRGALHVTNFARPRPDGAFTPTVQGVLSTPRVAGCPSIWTGCPSASIPRGAVVVRGVNLSPV